MKEYLNQYPDLMAEGWEIERRLKSQQWHTCQCGKKLTQYGANGFQLVDGKLLVYCWECKPKSGSK